MRFEKFLKFPIRSHMEQFGFRVWYEVRFMGKTIDVACFKAPRTTVSVEAKVRKLDDAIYQASVYRLWSDYSYIAIPRHASVTEENYNLLREEGIGLLRILGGRTPSVAEEVKPRKSKVLVTSRRRELIEVLLLLKRKGGVHA